MDGSYSVVEKYEQTMLRLLEFGVFSMYLKTWTTGADR